MTGISCYICQHDAIIKPFRARALMDTFAALVQG
jgi:hypothetical protein